MIDFWGYFFAPDNTYWRNIYSVVETKSATTIRAFCINLLDRSHIGQPRPVTFQQDKIIGNLFPWSQDERAYWAAWERVGLGLVASTERIKRRKML